MARPNEKNYQGLYERAYNLIKKGDAQTNYRDMQKLHGRAADLLREAAENAPGELKRKYLRDAERLEWPEPKGLGRRTVPALAILSIFSFAVALFFLSMNFTGAVIGNVGASGGQWIGLILILVGLAFAFVYFRNENRDVKRRSKRKR